MDKTSILSTISSTPSDDKLLSEKAIGDTFVKKTDITTHTSDTDIHITSAERTLWNDGVRRIALVGSEYKDTNGWYKVAEQTCSGYGNTNITFMVTSTYGNYNVGILQLQIRSDNSSISCRTLKWLTRIGFNVNHYIVVIDGMKWTLYAYQPSTRFGRIAFEILSMSSVNGKDMTWTLNFKDNVAKETTTPTATVISSDGASVADVGVTGISLTAPSGVTFSNSNVTYSISNGMCTVNLSFALTSTTRITWVSVANIPKPKGNVASAVISHMLKSPNILINVNANGNMFFYLDGAVSTTTYCGNFSYPVAES